MQPAKLNKLDVIRRNTFITLAVSEFSEFQYKIVHNMQTMYKEVEYMYINVVVWFPN